MDILIADPGVGLIASNALRCPDSAAGDGRPLGPGSTGPRDPRVVQSAPARRAVWLPSELNPPPPLV
jgi:hypothetical protein